MTDEQQRRPEQARLNLTGPKPAPEIDVDDETEHRVEIGGQTYVRLKGVAARVTLQGEDEQDVETIDVPYDPEQQPSEDDVIGQAILFSRRRKYWEEWLTTGNGGWTVETTLTGLRESGFFDKLAQQADEAVREVEISVDDPDLSDEAQRLTAITHDELGGVVRGMLVDGPDAEAFQQGFAYDAVLNTYLSLTYEFDEIGGDFDDNDTFQTFVRDGWQNAFTAALLTLEADTRAGLAELLVNTLQDPSLTDAMRERLEKLRKRRKREASRRPR
jgi:hypothetical protein